MMLCCWEYSGLSRGGTQEPHPSSLQLPALPPTTPFLTIQSYGYGEQ